MMLPRYFSTIGIVLAMLVLNACAKDNPVASIIIPNPVDTTLPRTSYLALGDSYTIGQSVPVADRFPVQTAGFLAGAPVKMGMPVIIAQTGWTTGNLLNALAQNPVTTTYDYVSLLIGVNNQYQGRSQEEYRMEFEQLLNKAIQYTGGKKNRVFVLSIPDYSVTPFGQSGNPSQTSQQIDEFNAINKAITLAAGVSYTDITPISRGAKTDPSLTANDGLHPSGKQYLQWSQLLAPKMMSSF